MTLFKHFLLITFLLTYVATKPVRAQEDSIVPESDSSSGTFVPPINSPPPVPPTIIDDTDSSGVPDTEDYDS